MALQTKHLLLEGSRCLTINVGETRRALRAGQVRAWQASGRAPQGGARGRQEQHPEAETADGSRADVGGRLPPPGQLGKLRGLLVTSAAAGDPSAALHPGEAAREILGAPSPAPQPPGACDGCNSGEGAGISV